MSDEPNALDLLQAQLAEAQARVLDLTGQVREAQALLRREAELHAQTKGELAKVTQDFTQLARRGLGLETALRDQHAVIRALEARVKAFVTWRANLKRALTMAVEPEAEAAVPAEGKTS